jgi:predicted ester cyclase
MSQTESTFQGYVTALLEGGDFAAYLDDDVVWTFMESGEEVRGRGNVRDLIVNLHTQAFKATPELRTLVVGDGVVAIEATFTGTHVGDYQGVAATGRTVSFPYSIFYTVPGEQITALRAYWPTAALVAQLQAF